MREAMSLRSIVLSSLFLLPGAVVAVENDFSTYPSAAESCLYSSVDGSGCNGDTVADNNQCLCGNEQGGWVTLVAQCLGSTGVDSSTISDTYSQMTTNCGDSDTPLALSREDFFNTVDEASSSTTSSTSSATDSSSSSKQTTADTTATSGTSTVVVTISGSATTLTTVVQPTNSGTATATETSSSSTSTGSADDNDSSGMSNTTKIGIIAGCVGVAVVGIIAAIYFIMRRRLKAARRAQVESHPMLGQQPSTAFPPADPTLPSQTPTVIPSPHPSAMHGGSPAFAAAGVYKDDDKWRQSGAWTPAQGGGYPPQTQWGQQQMMQNQVPPQGQMHAPYAVPGNQPPQTHFAAELPDNQDVRFHELGDSTPQGPTQGR
ncbi:hypothetical protein MKZ38_004531 [Zalerion maritima]|uniref:Uncharacterized protein n=1 Tax=Zalerion maritima TaxID=339359 RepID=A0AAD5WRK2_9PEZI|nr:hypothetical protein MKZ38_004531 [Zalerion maritima]